MSDKLTDHFGAAGWGAHSKNNYLELTYRGFILSPRQVELEKLFPRPYFETFSEVSLYLKKEI